MVNFLVSNHQMLERIHSIASCSFSIFEFGSSSLSRDGFSSSSNHSHTPVHCMNIHTGSVSSFPPVVRDVTITGQGGPCFLST